MQSYLVVVMEKNSGHAVKAIAEDSETEALETGQEYDPEYNVGIFPCDEFQDFTKD
jgi:hypothetical protein